MSALERYLTALQQGMAVVAECCEVTEDSLVKAGCPRQHARELRKLAQVYFGETKFRRLQASARETMHTLPMLLRIEKHVAKMRTRLDAWRLRKLLCATPADQIDQVAREHIRRPREAKRGVTLRRRRDLWSLTVTDKSSLIADLWKSVDQNHPVESLLRGGSASSLTTSVAVTLPELTEVVEGREDVELHMANGARISGRDFVQRRFTEHGFVTLISPVTGPVNLYRTSRVANWKQRTMLAAESCTCAWPGCNRPVEECQIHHIVPWKKGGLTNIENLVPLCPYHNGVNDDDGEGRRGRIERVKGKITWIPPWSSGVLVNSDEQASRGDPPRSL